MRVDPGSETVVNGSRAAGGEASGDSPGRMARRVMRRVDRAALATVWRHESGWPYPTLTLVALDWDGSPLLLVSTLAEHTRNFLADDRVGLLFDGTVGLADPLAGARVTVLGRMCPTQAPQHRARYLARHPGAALYDGFGDFAYYRVEVEQAHWVGGFGRSHWIDRAALILNSGSEAGALGGWAGEDALIRRIDPENIRALADRVIVQALHRGLGSLGTDDWALTGIDAEGCDLRRKGAVFRLDFEDPMESIEAAWAAIVQLATR